MSYPVPTWCPHMSLPSILARSNVNNTALGTEAKMVSNRVSGTIFGFFEKRTGTLGIYSSSVPHFNFVDPQTQPRAHPYTLNIAHRMVHTGQTLEYRRWLT